MEVIKKNLFNVTALLVLASVAFTACDSSTIDEPVLPAEAVETIETTEHIESVEPTKFVEPTEIVKSVGPIAKDYNEIPFGEPLVINTGCRENAIKEIAAINEFTIQVTMCKPDPAFISKVALPPLFITPREWVEAYANAENQERLLSQSVGTGPYYLESWSRGEKIVLKRFDDYWGEPAKTETLDFRWATESSKRLLELQSGSVDYIPQVNPDDYAKVESDKTLQLLRAPSPNIMYLAMTNTFEPWDDINVRKAIAIGIDRQHIVDNFYPTASEVASHFTPCSIPNGCMGESWYEFNVEEANRLLDEAGFYKGDEGIRFKTAIYYRDVYRMYLPEPGAVATEIQTQLRDNLSIEADVVVVESNEFIVDSTNGLLDGLYLLGWDARYLHITNFLDFHFGRSSIQFGNSFPEIYEVLEEASQTTDEAKTAELYTRANNTIKDLVPMIPIIHSASADSALVDVQNARAAIFGPPNLWEFVPRGRDTLVYLNTAEPVSLYCMDETARESFDACKMITEGLYQYDEFGIAQPSLATSCNANADATIWICTLREGIKFHDGSTLDANDVVRSWDAGLNAVSDYHIGNTGAFEYPSYLFNALMNLGE